MKYTKDEVMQYVAEEDVKFIRLAFCDVFGRQKNISVARTTLNLNVITSCITTSLLVLFSSKRS